MDVGIHRATVVEEFVEGCLDRIGEDDPEEEHLFRDLWEDENQRESLKKGGIGNVVVNKVVRMFTRKAVGRAMKSTKSASGKRKKDGPQEGFRQGQERCLVSLPGVEDQGGVYVGF